MRHNDNVFNSLLPNNTAELDCCFTEAVCDAAWKNRVLFRSFVFHKVSVKMYAIFWDILIRLKIEWLSININIVLLNYMYPVLLAHFGMFCLLNIACGNVSNWRSLLEVHLGFFLDPCAIRPKNFGINCMINRDFHVKRVFWSKSAQTIRALEILGLFLA